MEVIGGHDTTIAGCPWSSFITASIAIGGWGFCVIPIKTVSIRTNAVLATARPRQNVRLVHEPALRAVPEMRRDRAFHTRAGGMISPAAAASGVMRASHSATVCLKGGS